MTNNPFNPQYKPVVAPPPKPRPPRNDSTTWHFHGLSIKGDKLVKTK